MAKKVFLFPKLLQSNKNRVRFFLVSTSFIFLLLGNGFLPRRSTIQADALTTAPVSNESSPTQHPSLTGKPITPPSVVVVEFAKLPEKKFAAVENFRAAEEAEEALPGVTDLPIPEELNAR